MQNYHYDNVLTYSDSGLTKNNNKIYCKRNFVYLLVKKLNKNHEIFSGGSSFDQNTLSLKGIWCLKAVA